MKKAVDSISENVKKSSTDYALRLALHAWAPSFEGATYACIARGKGQESLRAIVDEMLRMRRCKPRCVAPDLAHCIIAQSANVSLPWQRVGRLCVSILLLPIRIKSSELFCVPPSEGRVVAIYSTAEQKTICVVLSSALVDARLRDLKLKDIACDLRTSSVAISTIAWPNTFKEVQDEAGNPETVAVCGNV